jgi:serine/threonine protein kinase
MPQDRAPLPLPSHAGRRSDPEPAQDGTDPLAGRTYFLGRYRVVDEIGVGGMASVHLARMDGPGGFQKWVAIKRIHPHLVEDETFVHMFLDEARVAARISHPNVATVYELGKHEDTYWIAMEYLHGEPLREVMRRTDEVGRPMPPEIACRVIADAAEGLHAAHELLGKNGETLGLVHRDVTPHNLFLTYDGSTKVVDFGIAKFRSRMAHTRAGTLKGKLAYMSPEQVGGEPVDRRTDVFALGVVLWELTTGQRLFRMESDIDTLAKVEACRVPLPSTLVRDYPVDLETIVMKALARNKNARYRSARELSRALQSLLMQRGLFIASDEVAAHMLAVFGDRIRKREAHLRWAADVTHTVDVQEIRALSATPWQPENPSVVSYSSSEVQPSTSSSRAPPGPGEMRTPANAGSASDRGDREDFDDANDTIVSHTMPEMDDLPGATSEHAAGRPAAEAVAHPYLASPATQTVAIGPRPVPTRAPASAHPADAPSPALTPLARPVTLPMAHARTRLPAGGEAPTFVAPLPRKKPVPLWAVAVGSALLGLLAFGVVVALVSRMGWHGGAQAVDPNARPASPTASGRENHP